MKKKKDNQANFSLRRIIFYRSRANEPAARSSQLSDLENGTFHEQSQKVTVDEKITIPETSHTDATSQTPMKNDHVCNICFLKESLKNQFFSLDLCNHKFCHTCLIKYLKNEICESRTDIACPQCPVAMHPNNIETILKDFPDYKIKYEDFMIRRYLVSDPDSRWCPAPDCSYAVIAAGCASCPQIKCERPNCGINFCYHCKAEWHPDQTCDAAKMSRQKSIRPSSENYTQDSIRCDEIKPCPRCQVLIVKMNDGSCNHMVCSVCGAEFCWLCMKEVSDLHYLSPSGCTFWGKKPWSRKKKIIWQIGTLIGAPVGIALLAGIAVPSMVIGIPFWVGRKLLERYKSTTKKKRNISVAMGVVVSILISPLLAGLAIAIGVPILLFYVYGIVPVSLCRAGCGSASSEEFSFETNINDGNRTHYNVDDASIGAVSKIGETSIGDASLSAISVSIVDNGHAHGNAQSSKESTTALAGSVKNQHLECCDSMSFSSGKSLNYYNSTSNKVLSGIFTNNK